MERYDIDELGCMSPRADGDYVLYADAQRALDAEREKVKELNEQLRLANCDQVNTENDLNDVTAQLATLQAQLAQPIRVCQGCGRVSRDGWVTARYECDELHGSLQCPDCQCIDLETNTAKELAALCTQAQAQLRHVEGENELLKSGQRYMALEKERDTLRQLVEAILLADERGQGLPFKEAMDAAAKAINWNSLPPHPMEDVSHE